MSNTPTTALKSVAVFEQKLLSLCPGSQQHKALVLFLCLMQSFLEGLYFSVLAVMQYDLSSKFEVKAA